MSAITSQLHAVTPDAPSTTVKEPSTEPSHARPRRTAPPHLSRTASDDEILGIGRTPEVNPGADDSSARNQPKANAEDGDAPGMSAESRNGAELDTRTQAALDSIPELRRAWEDAHSYRESFGTPEEARVASALLSDLDRMDALFFSRRPENHAELARAVAELDPVAFASLAKVMNGMAPNRTDRRPPGAQAAAQQDGALAGHSPDVLVDPSERRTPTPAQVDFLNSANAAAVQGVLDAIEIQIDRLLPRGVSKNARNRVVGEIYRELDTSLGSNRQLGQQIRDALRLGNLDLAHQRAIVALVTGRARQALPAIAKRVLSEWTSTVVAANQDRLSRQRTAANRVDIAGSGHGGDGGRRSLAPRDIDYARMSDSDILNL